jgi:DNA-binding response OmpR family regulator
MPISMMEFIVWVNNLLELMNSSKNGKINNGYSINIGKYVFNTQKYELRLGEQIRKLSHREAQILNMLIEKKNNAIDKRKIMKVIWVDNSFFNSRKMDVYITKLQDYLKEDPDIQAITLKGIRYHFSFS